MERICCPGTIPGVNKSPNTRIKLKIVTIHTREIGGAEEKAISVSGIQLCTNQGNDIIRIGDGCKYLPAIRITYFPVVDWPGPTNGSPPTEIVIEVILEKAGAAGCQVASQARGCLAKKNGLD
jgi:hypothetical protein